MVNPKTLFLSLLCSFALLLNSPSASALFARTQSDLRAVSDRLAYEFPPVQRASVTPVLVAPPQFYWEESKKDFSAAMMETLARVFPNTGDLIVCAECYTSRVYVSHDNRMVIQNGELSLPDLARLRQEKAYASAKSLLVTRETPAGIEIRMVAIDDGRILYTGLADSSQSLDRVERPMRLAREMDRRQRGESLSYINFDLGLYPKALVQLKFLEQWGSHNQHLSGLAISAFNPAGAIGVTYQYMVPSNRRMTAELTGYYGLKGLFDSSSSSIGSALSGQIAGHYAISGSYGVFIAASTEGVLSAGFSLLNPVLFPFLL